MSAVVHNPAIVAPGAAAPPSPSRSAARPAGGPSFADVLRSQSSELQFSGHALQRVQRRGIDVSPGTLERLQGGVARAAGKGSRESVVFVDNTAFVVSVRNRTVITAVDREHMKDQVFTNIDSAVVA